MLDFAIQHAHSTKLSLPFSATFSHPTRFAYTTMILRLGVDVGGTNTYVHSDRASPADPATATPSCSTYQRDRSSPPPSTRPLRMSPRASSVLSNLSSIRSRMPPISRPSPSAQPYVTQRPCDPTQLPPALCQRTCREKPRPSRSGCRHPSLWAIHPWDSPIRWFSTRPEK